MNKKKANFERVNEEIEEYLEQEELAELTRKREWERKYGADPEPSHRNSNDSESSQDSSTEKSNNTNKHSHKYYQSNDHAGSSIKTGEPQHSSDNSRSGKLLQCIFRYEKKNCGDRKRQLTQTI